MAVIAMTREMGTHGKDVVAGVADRLDLSVVHHQLVEQEIAERSGMQEGEIHRALEGEATLFEKWQINRARLTNYTEQEILEVAAKGNVIIRGWGATYLLRSIPHIPCIRLCAPMEARVKTVMQQLSIGDVRTARREIRRSDAAHNGTMQKFFGVDWTDATLYSLVLNSSRIPVNDCIDHIVRLVESEAYAETEQSRSNLMDELIRTRVHAAVDQHYGAQASVLGIEAEVKNGHVSLSGAMIDAVMIEETVRLVQAVDGVESVENHIAHVDIDG